MRTGIYLVCACAMVVAVPSSPDDPRQFVNSRFLEPVDVAVDPETINYLLPKLAAKYKPNSEWKDVTDPRLYVLTEMESNDVDSPNGVLRKLRNKRNNGYGITRLSVNAPVSVLRDAFDREKLKQRKLKVRALIEELLNKTP
ncbi:uncharacterized protein LOC115878750 isoform X2 [Sitophilus oryzae]|uniref:Uncharacterized protein LOC115878750 isoform X2 n=1 Tax=Sitophilus oryzae TaxID=7048 RepID=A0A6J2XKM5_SITOR|nr:uncharacterized protein LOC115878750 isoform X2 [Sitophilus oryzae]